MASPTLTDRWLGRLGDAGVLMARPDEARAQLGGWLELLAAASEGDASAESDLFRLVALHGRNLGAAEKPASAVVLQPLLLEDLLRESMGPEHRTTRLARELVRIAADAHALGAAERIEGRHRRVLADAAPMLRLGDRAVVGWLVGPMNADAIDAILGRLLRESVGAEIPAVVLDLASSDRPSDVLVRTLQGFLASEHADRVRLALTGLSHTAALRARLAAAAPADHEKIDLAPSLRTYLTEESLL